MRYLLFILIPLFVYAKTLQPIKIASYNVQNLFDAKTQGTEYDEYIVGKHNWSKKMSALKVDRTAEVICDLNADIIGLQEIENSYILAELLKRLKRVGCEYKYSAISHKKGSAIQVALLSRFRIKKSKDLEVSYAPKVRNILRVDLEIDSKPLTIFVNHWKSKSRNGYESKRIKYAKRLEKEILSMPKDREYIILGDLNSNYDAHLSLSKKLDDTNGKRAISHTLKTLYNNTLIDKKKIKESSWGSHYNTWQELPYKDRWSHKFYGNRSTLDHILLPSFMFNNSGINYVDNSFKVFKSSNLFTKKGYINAWKIKSGKHIGKGYSDHLPIYAYFDFKPYKSSVKNSKSKVKLSETIESLYKVEQLETPLKLENVVVLLKRGKYAVIKQSEKGRGVFIYGSANSLQEGRSYNILVKDITTYKGLKEITHFEILEKKQRVKLKDFYKNVDIKRQNEVLTNLVGEYKNRYLYFKSKKIPIYFKNKKITPKNGSKIKIHYAHIGYYKRLQLVIYSKKDFTILEK